MRDSRRVGKGLLALLGLWAGAAQVRAEPFVEHLSPPALARGTTCRVTLVGSEMAGATGLWTSLPAQDIRATLVEPGRGDQATFDVSVRPDAPLGVYGLRLATTSGLSNAKLFLIDDLPTVTEREPGTSPRAPQALTWPVAVLGKAGEADVDAYTLDVEAGQRLTFEVVGSRLGQDFDPVVTIKDARGRRVVERDNDVGLMFDCRFAHTFDRAGTYTIELQDTRFRGSDHLVYVLRVGRFPAGRVAFPSTVRAGDAVALSVPGDAAFRQEVAVPKASDPVSFFQEIRRAGDQASSWVPLQVGTYTNTLEQEPNDDPATAPLATIPTVLHGTIATARDRDAFAFAPKAGQRLTVRVECRPLGSPADLDVSLLAPDGKTLKRLDTIPDGAAVFEFQAKAEGRHVLAVRSLTGEGGPESTYRITIAPREPAVQLVSEASSLAIPRGSYQPLPLTVARTDFRGPIALELRGAPAGMTLRTGSIGEGETELDNALSVADTVAEGLYSVQVVARMQADGREGTAIATTLPLIDRLPTGRGPHGEPFELREDQRRLPPTLTDRIAILVTPPSPYSFDLPDRSVVLPRYLETTFRLETTRVAGFDAPITFVARGGTLEPLNLQKPRVRAEIPPATRDRASVTGVLRSGVNSELRKHRVTVTAEAGVEGRTIALTRTFELRTQVAFEPAADPQRLEIAAGDAATVAIRANRLAPFQGAITIRPAGESTWGLPSALEIAEGSDRAEMRIVVPPGAKPGVYRVALAATARVSKFDDAATAKPIEVVVVAAKGGGRDEGK